MTKREGNEETTKIQVEFIEPIHEALERRVRAGCFRRDALLERVVRAETPRLKEEMTAANSPEAELFLRRALKATRRTPVTVRMASNVVASLDAVCREKRVVRNVFLNRVALLLVASKDLLHRMFDTGSFERRMNREWELPTDTAGWQLLRLAEDLVDDPFWHIRACLEYSAADGHDPGNLYTAYIPDNLLGDPRKPPKAGRRRPPNTLVLNTHLPDELVPDHPASAKALAALEIELPDLEP